MICGGLSITKYVCTHVHAYSVAQVAASSGAQFDKGRRMRRLTRFCATKSMWSHTTRLNCGIAEFQLFFFLLVPASPLKGNPERTAEPESRCPHLCPHTLPSSHQPSTPASGEPTTASALLPLSSTRACARGTGLPLTPFGTLGPFCAHASLSLRLCTRGLGLAT